MKLSKNFPCFCIALYTLLVFVTVSHFMQISVTQAQEVPVTKSRSEDEAISATTPKVRFAAIGMRDARERLVNIQALVTYHSERPKLYYERENMAMQNPLLPISPDEKARFAKAPVAARETTSVSRFYYKDPSIFIESMIDPKVSAIQRSRSVIINDHRAFLLDHYDENKGQSQKLNDESGFYNFGFIRPAKDVLTDGLVNNFHLSDPRFYAYFDNLWDKSIDEQLLLPESKAVYQGEELINGSRCMKIEVSFLQDAKIIYWLDVEHDFLLRRREERTYKGEDMLREETVVPQVQESNGVWLPISVEIRQFLDLVKSQPGQSPDVDASKVVLLRTTFSEFKTNIDIPDSTFVMKWPKGTNVRNQINQTGFVAGTDDPDEEPQPVEQKTDAKTDGVQKLPDTAAAKPTK